MQGAQKSELVVRTASPEDPSGGAGAVTTTATTETKHLEDGDDTTTTFTKTSVGDYSYDNDYETDTRLAIAAGGTRKSASLGRVPVSTPSVKTNNILSRKTATTTTNARPTAVAPFKSGGLHLLQRGLLQQELLDRRNAAKKSRKRVTLVTEDLEQENENRAPGIGFGQGAKDCHEETEEVDPDAPLAVGVSCARAGDDEKDSAYTRVEIPVENVTRGFESIPKSKDLVQQRRKVASRVSAPTAHLTAGVGTPFSKLFGDTEKVIDTDADLLEFGDRGDASTAAPKSFVDVDEACGVTTDLSGQPLEEDSDSTSPSSSRSPSPPQRKVSLDQQVSLVGAPEEHRKPPPIEAQPLTTPTRRPPQRSSRTAAANRILPPFLNLDFASQVRKRLFRQDQNPAGGATRRSSDARTVRHLRDQEERVGFMAQHHDQGEQPIDSTSAAAPPELRPPLFPPEEIPSEGGGPTAARPPRGASYDFQEFIPNWILEMTNQEDMAMATQSVDLIVNRIRHILSNSGNLRQALYFRLLRITQYLSWKFPAYGALQHLLEDVLRSKAIIGAQTTTIHLLGKRFAGPTERGFEQEWNRKFLFTYRKGFRSIPNNEEKKITTDQGWGCYIRTFQMMLAQCYSKVVFRGGVDDSSPFAAAMQMHQPGQPHPSSASSSSSSTSGAGRGGHSSGTLAQLQSGGSTQMNDVALEREFVKELFVDNDSALFSVHNFCRVGREQFNRKPGTWFGPFSAAKTIEVIYEEIKAGGGGGGGSAAVASRLKFAPSLTVSVFDELFDPDEVKAKLAANGLANPQRNGNFSSGGASASGATAASSLGGGSAAGAQQGVICLLCKKLGPNQNVAPEYTEAVKQIFKLQTFQGLACGDTATSAHYFIAASDTYCYYLDPHVETRTALDGAEMDTENWHALKSSDGKPMLLKLAFENLNSSCCFCFLIRDQEDLAQLCLELEMYDALHEAFEVKRGGFLDSLTGSLDLNDKNAKWDEDEDGMVLL